MDAFLVEQRFLVTRDREVVDAQCRQEGAERGKGPVGGDDDQAASLDRRHPEQVAALADRLPNQLARRLPGFLRPAPEGRTNTGALGDRRHHDIALVQEDGELDDCQNRDDGNATEDREFHDDGPSRRPTEARPGTRRGTAPSAGLATVAHGAHHSPAPNGQAVDGPSVAGRILAGCRVDGRPVGGRLIQSRIFEDWATDRRSSTGWDANGRRSESYISSGAPTGDPAPFARHYLDSGVTTTGATHVNWARSKAALTIAMIC
jgi:hypothetical protein